MKIGTKIDGFATAWISLRQDRIGQHMNKFMSLTVV